VYCFAKPSGNCLERGTFCSL